MKGNKISHLLLLFAAFLFLTQCASNKDEVGLRIEKPVKHINLPQQSKVINPRKDTLIQLASGSSIFIPANAFVDDYGYPIVDPVTIEYTEINTPAEIIASGIPMTIVDGKETHVFQSAGMFDIKAKCMGSYRIKLKEDKFIQVYVASNKADLDYNNYYFDENLGNWVELAKTVKPKATPEAMFTAIDTSVITEIEGERPPVELEEYNKSMVVFEMDLDYSQIPELKDFESLMWKFGGKDKSMDPLRNKWIFKRNWDYATIKPEGGVVRLDMRDGDKTFSTVLKPVTYGKTAKKALATYKNSLKEYQDKLELLNLEKQKRNAIANNKNLNIGQFQRMIMVQAWGVYNCDRYYKKENLVVMNGTMRLNGKTMPLGTKFYHISKKDQIYYDVSSMTMQFNPEADNSVIAFLPSGEVAVSASDNLAMVEPKNGETGTDFTLNFRMEGAINGTPELEALMAKL